MVCGMIINAIQVPSLVAVNFEDQAGNLLGIRCSTGELEAPSRLVIVGTVIVVTIDAVVTALVIWAKNRRWIREFGVTNTLVEKVYQDAILYFFTNTLAALAAIAITVKSTAQSELALRLASTLTSVVACRMIIGLKDIGGRQSLFGDSILPFASALSTIRFGSTAERGM
ncbi:hypothetical protein NP233_g3131 [Leucocoprinus birnbaumii]|uniref:Uncharacterized protein n=1 Tax=Leucocoprinus birnbaumii TaxID=56174 RepID=A0AAD5W000_9AGAR|nr:hypothetical protein NP233_g3131 [Leucocoprinus birnbaumii]